jgi:hypothetical protein
MSRMTHLLSRGSMWQYKFFCPHSKLDIIVFLILRHSSFCKQNEIHNKKKFITILLEIRLFLGKGRGRQAFSGRKVYMGKEEVHYSADSVFVTMYTDYFSISLAGTKLGALKILAF